MKKIKRIITLLLMTLLLTNCGKEKLSLNEEVTLTGKVSHQEVIENDLVKKISILTLDKPVIIDGDLVKKVELEYDKDLKTDTNITIKGTIKDNGDSTYNYLFSVQDIDDILSFVNTYSNEYFRMTIPTSIIKEVSVIEIDDGYSVSLDNDEKKIEVFQVIYLNQPRYEELNNDEDIDLEVADSKDDKKVVIIYSSEDIPDNKLDTLESINKAIPTIKGNIRLK